MALIDVTIDVRDFDPTGPAPGYPSVTIARLSPGSDSGVLVTTNPVPVPLTGGHGVVTLRTQTAYLVRCLGFGGFAGTFAVTTGTTATTLAQLWQTSQIDPTTFASTPVPQTVEQALAAQAATAAATYVTFDGSNLRKNGTVIPVSGSGGSSSVIDNGDGTFTASGSGVTDNGDGTFTIAS